MLSFQQLFTKLVHIANFTLVLPTGGGEGNLKQKKESKKERKKGVETLSNGQ